MLVRLFARLMIMAPVALVMAACATSTPSPEVPAAGDAPVVREVATQTPLPTPTATAAPRPTRRVTILPTHTPRPTPTATPTMAPTPSIPAWEYWDVPAERHLALEDLADAGEEWKTWRPFVLRACYTGVQSVMSPDGAYRRDSVFASITGLPKTGLAAGRCYDMLVRYSSTTRGRYFSGSTSWESPTLGFYLQVNRGPVNVLELGAPLPP